VRFNSSKGIVSVRVDYYSDPVDTQNPVKVEAFIYSKAIPTFEETVPLSLSINENEYIFTVNIIEEFKPLDPVKSNIGSAILMFGDKVSYYWGQLNLQFDFMEDMIVARFSDLSRGDESTSGEDQEAATQPPPSDEGIETGDGGDSEEDVETGETGEAADNPLIIIGAAILLLALVGGFLIYNKVLRGG